MRKQEQDEAAAPARGEKKSDPIVVVFAYPKSAFESGPIFDKAYSPPNRSEQNVIANFFSKAVSQACPWSKH
jgi:hypothetical protein